jgi:hypothetical protein
MFYAKLLDGFYSGNRVEYTGIYEANGSFTVYENSTVLCNLEPSHALGNHYTNPSVMPYYNLACQLITEGEKS